jgi:hypothetical protein
MVHFPAVLLAILLTSIPFLPYLNYALNRGNYPSFSFFYLYLLSVLSAWDLWALSGKLHTCVFSYSTIMLIFFCLLVPKADARNAEMGVHCPCLERAMVWRGWWTRKAQWQVSRLLKCMENTAESQFWKDIPRNASEIKRFFLKPRFEV